MPEPFSTGLKLAWLSIVAYWIWSARRVKAPEKVEHVWKRLLGRWLPLGVALLLLGPGRWFGHSLLRQNFVPHTTLVYSIGLACCFGGAALAIWSRHILGRNWSASVEIKQGHELITAGPYGVVRHPIYSGLLLVFVGNCLMVGDWRGILAVGIVFVSFWLKLRVEERWLQKRFGEQYAAYRRRTHAIVPGVL